MTFPAKSSRPHQVAAQWTSVSIALTFGGPKFISITGPEERKKRFVPKQNKDYQRTGWGAIPEGIIYTKIPRPVSTDDQLVFPVVPQMLKAIGSALEIGRI